MTDPTLCQPLRLAEPITGGPFRRGGRFSPATWRKFSVQLASLIRYMQSASEMMERLIKDMAERQGVTERLKAENQLRWVGMMNNIRSAAEEVVLNNLIYA